MHRVVTCLRFPWRTATWDAVWFFSLSRLAVFWQFCLTCLRERKGEWNTSFLLAGEWSMRVFKRQKARSDACITFFFEKLGVETSFSCSCWVYFQSWCNSRNRICLSRTYGQTCTIDTKKQLSPHAPLFSPSKHDPNTAFFWALFPSRVCSWKAWHTYCLLRCPYLQARHDLDGSVVLLH